MSGKLNGQREVFMLYFIPTTGGSSKIFRIRNLSGKILSATPNVKFFDTDCEVNLEDCAGQVVVVCFECLPIHGKWLLLFGDERGWNYSSIIVNSLALIRTSKPLNKAEGVELPRFVINPKLSYKALTVQNTGSAGQIIGRHIRSMRTLEVSFMRIKKEAFDIYYNKVSVVTPHWIIPYPEDVSNIYPIWGVLDGAPEFDKRADSNWTWNIKLKFRECY
jgi:hypothetical protein